MSILHRFMRLLSIPFLLSGIFFLEPAFSMPEWYRQLKPDSLTLKKTSRSKNQITPLAKIDNKNKERSPHGCSHNQDVGDPLESEKNLLNHWYYQECIETGRHEEGPCIQARSSITKFIEELKNEKENKNLTPAKTAFRAVPACALDVNNFAPAEHHPVKILNTVFFFPRRVNKEPAGNFTLNHDGWGNTSYNATRVAQDTMNLINQSLANNQRQAWNGDLNPFPIPPVLPIQIQLRPTQPMAQEILLPPDQMMGPLGAVNGVHPFYFSENWSTQIVRSYTSPHWFHFSFRNRSGTRPRFFPLPDLPGAIPGLAPSPLRPVARTGVGYAIRDNISNFFWSEGGDVQLSRIWHNGDPLQDSKVHLHELSHLLGNNHTFDNSFFDELWVQSSNGGWSVSKYTCDDVTKENDLTWCGKNNNIMDYNCLTNAWTPCQLKTAHYNLSHLLRQRRYLPCKADRQYNHELRGIPGTQYTWDGPHDVIGDLILYPGVTLTINCSVTLAENARIIKPPSSRIINEHLITRRKCDYDNHTLSNGR